MQQKKLQIPYIQISTDYVFSGHNNSPWQVFDRTEPMTIYGQSKLAGELSVQDTYCEGSYIIRTAWLYSQYGNNFAKKIIRKLLNSQDVIHVVNDQFGQPTSARDLSFQIIRIIENSLPFGIYHSTNSGAASWFDFSQRILRNMGERRERIMAIASTELRSRVSRPNYTVLDHTKWLQTNVLPLRNWEIALDDIFPVIFDRTREELSDG